MQVKRTLSYIHSELKAKFPQLTIVMLARLCNMYFNESDLVVNEDHEEDYDVVSGTSFYDFPTDKNVIGIRSVHYKNTDGYYKPVPEIVGVNLLGDE